MRSLLNIITTTALLTLTSHALASDDRPDHFKGLPSENLEQALQNIYSHNAHLNRALQGELTPTTMHTIHELTYTLEVALERIASSIETLQEQLEEVHLGSESLDTERVRSNGQLYLDGSKALTTR